jgi:predicted DNA binding CopG/RHH family protein
MKKIKLNKYEQGIEENILNYKSILGGEREKIERLIKNAKEKKNISLRLNSQNLSLLKIRAEQEGSPYQTFISSILHKFVTEQLVDQKEVIKSIRLMKQHF